MNLRITFFEKRTMVVHTRNALKIKMKSYYFDENNDDDDENDVDYIPPSSEEEDDDDNYMDEDEEDDDLTTTITTTANSLISRQDVNKKYILTSPEFIALLKRVEELDPDIYQFINAENIKDKDKIRICELYTIMFSQQPFSIEWIDIRSLIKHEMKQIMRKVCIFKDVDKTELDSRLQEFKNVKTHFDTPIKEKIILLDAPIETKSVIYAKYKELSEYSVGDTEYAKIYTWLQYALSVPYNITKPLSITSHNICDFLNTVYTKLNQEFYGLQKVKEQILLFLNMKLTNPNSKNYNLALLGSKGVGKCFIKDTPVLMHDFTIKMVQDVNVGDKLMGKNGMPRVVKTLVQGGFDKVYTVSPKYSEPYTVCHGHLMVLMCISNLSWISRKLYTMNCKKGDVVKLPVERFFGLPRYIQKKFTSINIPIEKMGPSSSEFDIDPYLLGMWYGGNDVTSTIFNTDSRLFSILATCAHKYQSKVTTLSEDGTKGIYTFKPYEYSDNLYDPNLYSFDTKLKQMGIWGKWSIPRKYKTCSIVDRCRFIAGFLDVSGTHVGNSIKCHLRGTEMFIRELVGIIRSVGLHCIVNGSTINVFGKFSILPLVVHNDVENIPIQNTIKVTQPRWDFYYGFEVDDDHLFLLGDYTLVHNCFAANTPIQMFDSSVKNVQDIVSGDVLMGDDLKPRVVWTTTTGTEDMYTVHQSNGMTYTVNKSHILSLMLPKYNKIGLEHEHSVYRIFRVDKTGTIRYFDIIDGSDIYYDVDYHHDVYYIDMTVSEYLELDVNIRSYLRGYKKPSVSSMYDLQKMEENVARGIVCGLRDLRSSTSFATQNVEHSSTSFKLPNELNYLLLPFDSVYENKYYTILNTRNNIKHASCKPSKEFLAGILISRLEYTNSTWTLNQQHSIYRHLYNQLNIDVEKALYTMSPLQLIQRLICHDPLLDCFVFQSDINVEFKGVGTYYGFTLADDSPNRRFLLSDGTVVHNTHISRTLASIMDFPFEQISMGNVTNAEILTGHQYTYVGSRPGAILNALIDSKYKNGIIFLDEFDKVQNIDVSNTLLHIVDTTQNHQFVDNYLGQQIKIDLSNIWFIFAMNAVPESGPLKDRIFVIEIDGYNLNEKCIITRDYLLPRVCKNAGLNVGDIIIDEDATRYLVNKFTTADESDNHGVRYIEKKLADFVNKVMFLVNTGSCFTDLSFSIKRTLTYPVHISHELIDSLLTKTTKVQPFTLMYT